MNINTLIFLYVASYICAAWLLCELAIDLLRACRHSLEIYIRDLEWQFEYCDDARARRKIVFCRRVLRLISV